METGEAGKEKPASAEHTEQETTRSSESEEERSEGFLASKHGQHHHHPVDIDADTPIDAVRAPGCFNRLKEEVEAVVETLAEKMHLKKKPS
ncbi:hypothetical protein R1sor_003141 [Riccia sorocarpa]|uniref:Uncharacterized protein n=1 Tax=Riccia sorocarpa TaxID=122646 RepID=A0ABD3H4M3_9MARC